MRQVTLRLPADLAARLKRAAEDQNRSVNNYATAVLAAAVDPELADDEGARVRERLARAGLLAPLAQRRAGRPDSTRVERARERAGSGRSLAELVSEGRR